jgi:plasmid replication initiation protein
LPEIKSKKKLGTIVKVSNDLARAHWSTENVWEIRVVSAVASLVQDSDEEFHTYSIPLASLGRDFTLGRNYEDIRKAIHRLVKKDVEVKGEGKNFRVYSIFAMCGVEDGELIAGFHPDLKPLFLDLKERFTLYQAKEIMKLPSIYSQKMFMLLKSWVGRTDVTISIVELRNLLNVPDSFRKNFKDFRRRVLEQSHEDINKLTSLHFEWKAVKNGRSVTAIHFIFSDIAKILSTSLADEEITTLQAKSSKCFEKLQRMGKECVARPRSKICRYCMDRGRMHARNHTASAK